MKKIILFVCVIFLTGNLSAKKVRLSVDMTGQIISSFGIHVMGDFQSAAGFGADYTPNTCTMAQDAADTNVYHFVVDIPAFTKYEYKFINGDQSYEVEVVPLESQVGYNFDDNRWVYVDSLNSDTLQLPAFVFGANCAAGMNMIRFLVDMTLQTSTTDGIHVAGSFQGNDPSITRMYSFRNHVFEIISYMPLGNYTYKYYSGNTTGTSENVPATCASAGDRTITLSSDILLPVVCFSNCSTCYPTSLPSFSKVSSFEMYPNPMSSSMKINFGDDSEFHHLAITDASGRLVRKMLHITEKSVSVDRSGLSNGVYIVSVQNESGRRTSTKLIIE